MVYRRSKVNIRRPMRRRATRSGRPTSSTKRRRTTRRAPKPCVCPSDLSPGARFALAQIDPFHSLAVGAKIPDSNTIPSIAHSDVDMVNMVTASTIGWFTATAFRPFYRGGTITGTPTTGGVTWGATFASLTDNRTNTGLYSNAVELTRPVAHAIRLTSPIAPTSATGFVHIGLAVEQIVGTTWDFPSNPSEMTKLQFYKRVTLASLTQSPLTVINKWIDDTAFRYSAPTETITNEGAGPGGTAAQWQLFQTDHAWATIIVMVEGATGPTTSTILSAEHLLLSEGIPNRKGVLIGTPAAVNSPGLLSAVNQVQSNSEPFHNEAQQESYISENLGQLVEGAKQAGMSVMQAVQPLVDRAAQAGGTAFGRYVVNSIMGKGGLPGVNANPNRLSLQS